METRLAGERATRFDQIFPLQDQNGPYTAVPFSRPGRVYWGAQDTDQSVVWWKDDATTSGDILEIPDPDAWYIGDLGGVQTFDTIWQSGGSDGVFHFMVVIGADGRWFVDKFDVGMTVLLDRFPISDWSSWAYFSGEEADYPYFDQTTNTKPLAADTDRIAVVGLKYPYDYDLASIQVAVLDTDGVTLHDHKIVLHGEDPGSDLDYLEGEGSSCIGNGKFYFPIHTYDWSATAVVSIDLETGVYERLFTLDQGSDDPGVNELIARVDPTWFSYEFYPERQDADHGALGAVDGLLCVPDSTDLIVSSGLNVTGGGIARVTADGTPVWWRHGDSISSLFDDGWWGLVATGRNTFWASRTDVTFLADEFTWDGELVRTIELPYPARHAWAVGSTPPRGIATPNEVAQRIRARHDTTVRGRERTHGGM